MKNKIQMLLIALTGIALTILFVFGIFRKIFEAFEVDYNIGVIGIIFVLVMILFYVKRSR